MPNPTSSTSSSSSYSSAHHHHHHHQRQCEVAGCERHLRGQKSRFCVHHHGHARALARNTYRANGLCLCGREPKEGRASCHTCLERRQRNRKPKQQQQQQQSSSSFPVEIPSGPYQQHHQQQHRNHVGRSSSRAGDTHSSSRSSTTTSSRRGMPQQQQQIRHPLYSQHQPFMMDQAAQQQQAYDFALPSPHLPGPLPTTAGFTSAPRSGGVGVGGGGVAGDPSLAWAASATTSLQGSPACSPIPAAWPFFGSPPAPPTITSTNNPGLDYLYAGNNNNNSSSSSNANSLNGSPQLFSAVGDPFFNELCLFPPSTSTEAAPDLADPILFDNGPFGSYFGAQEQKPQQHQDLLDPSLFGQGLFAPMPDGGGGPDQQPGGFFPSSLDGGGGFTGEYNDGGSGAAAGGGGAGAGGGMLAGAPCWLSLAGDAGFGLFSSPGSGGAM